MTTQRGERRFHLLPTTTAGRWAVALGLAFLLWVPLSGGMMPPGVGKLFLVAGPLGGCLAIYAVVRRGERALLVLLPLVPAAAVAGFAIAEALFPHG